MSWKEIAEYTGLAAIVASLIFVGLEPRQSQNIGLAEGYSAIFAARLEASKSIKEHVVLWRQGTAGEDLNESDAASWRRIQIVRFNVISDQAASAAAGS